MNPRFLFWLSPLQALALVVSARLKLHQHNTLKRDMDHFIKECAHLFHNRQLKGHLSLSFYIQFFKQCVSVPL